MAKLSRIVAKVFGSAAGTDQISVFGSLFAGSPAFSTNPATVQSLSNWLTGWVGAAIGGNAPAIEDMNAAFFVSTYQLAYLMQAGVAEWNTDTVYYTGSMVQVDGLLYVSLADDNTGNAVTDVTKWQPFGGKFKSVTASETAALTDSIIIGNSSGGSFIETLPPVASAKYKHYYLKNIDTSSNVMTVKADGSELIDTANTLPLYAGMGAHLFCDGVKWRIMSAYSPSPANDFYMGFFGAASLWTTASPTYVDPTNSGGNTLTSRYNSTMSVAAAASNAFGVTFTPANAGAKYRVTMAVTIDNSSAASSSAVRLVDGSGNVLGSAVFHNGASGAVATTLTVDAIFAPGSVAPQTLKLQMLASGGTARIGDEQSGENGSWTIERIA